MKARLRFAKHGDLRLVGHQDLMRLLERALRRAAVPMAKSRGFTPRPKIVFPLALALGIEGRREVVELELSEPIAVNELLRRLAAESPPGLDWLEAESIAPGARAPRVETARYELPIPPERQVEARAAIGLFLAAEQRPYLRRRHNGDHSTIDLRPFVLDADMDPSGLLRLRLRITPEGSARPDEVLDSLALRDLLDNGTILVRADVELAENPTNAPPYDPETNAPTNSSPTPVAEPYLNQPNPNITPGVSATERSPV